MTKIGDLGGTAEPVPFQVTQGRNTRAPIAGRPIRRRRGWRRPSDRLHRPSGHRRPRLHSHRSAGPARNAGFVLRLVRGSGPPGSSLHRRIRRLACTRWFPMNAAGCSSAPFADQPSSWDCSALSAGPTSSSGSRSWDVADRSSGLKLCLVSAHRSNCRCYTSASQNQCSCKRCRRGRHTCRRWMFCRQQYCREPCCWPQPSRRWRFARSLPNRKHCWHAGCRPCCRSC